eukprot:c24677_g1_i1 orf=128-3100(+)
MQVAMAQTRPARPRIGFVAKPASHLLLMELKHRILAALSKLADRDTQQIALEDLEKVVESLSPECVHVCLSCLYDTDMQQKSVVKKECVRLFGTLACLHASFVAPHLPKIIGSLMRRLRDPDTSVRDACADTMGVLSAQFLSSTPHTDAQESGTQSASALTLATFVKPLFDALSEQNKSVQIGAAMSLARVVENAKSPPLGGMQRLCLRICKFLSNPNFLARAALLPVIGSLSQVGAIGQQHLATLVPCMHEAMESNDWATRKAAAESLALIASNLGPALGSFKVSTLLVLESYRFDKVKPVRDSVQDSIQLWKNLPDPEQHEPGTETKSGNIFSSLSMEAAATDGSDLSSVMRNTDLQMPSSPSHSPSATAPVSTVPNGFEYIVDSGSKQHSKLTTDKCGPLKKRIPVLTDRKPNPDFFQKLEMRGTEDWQVEVAIPRSCPQFTSTLRNKEHRGIDDADFEELLGVKEQKGGERGNGLAHLSSVKDGGTNSQSGQPKPGRLFGETDDTLDAANSMIDMTVLNGNLPIISHGDMKLKAKQAATRSWLGATLQQKDADNLSFEAGGHGTSSLSIGSYGDAGENKANWLFVRRQLSDLEHQQSNILEMLQDFMGSSQEAMLSLEERVRRLEIIVEEMSQDLALPTCRKASGILAGCEDGGAKFSSSYHLGPDYINHKFGKAMNSHISFQDRLGASGAAIPGGRGVREPLWKSSNNFDADDCSGHGYGSSIAESPAVSLMHSQVGVQRSNMGAATDQMRVGKDDLVCGQIVDRRGWDRVSAPTRLGEGPSARSVWQASKDEATLEAIRVAGEDAHELDPEALISEQQEIRTQNLVSEGVSLKSDGQGKGRIWSLWSQVMEFVRAGDIDLAYAGVLCRGDELMLVRLMNKTGPVLEQLSSSTTSEMLHSVSLLLQQQSFFDFSIPWVQQVADMVIENGAECLGLSVEAKKELLFSLQEATAMDLPEGWGGNTVDELLEQLANVWPIEVLHESDH